MFLIGMGILTITNTGKSSASPLTPGNARSARPAPCGSSAESERSDILTYPTDGEVPTQTFGEYVQLNNSDEVLAYDAIVGEDVDANRIICVALTCAKRRVVVKRPRHASPLPGPDPFTAILGKSTRYDIYPITGHRNCAHYINDS